MKLTIRNNSAVLILQSTDKFGNTIEREIYTGFLSEETFNEYKKCNERTAYLKRFIPDESEKSKEVNQHEIFENA